MRQLKISKSITNRESASLEKYLQEIGKVPLISPEEEVRLTTLAKQGDKSAVDCLVRSNLRFVVSVPYQGRGSRFSLINEGNIGLIKAVERLITPVASSLFRLLSNWVRQGIMSACDHCPHDQVAPQQSDLK
jgi:RNA polymerase primary sigma factor